MMMNTNSDLDPQSPESRLAHVASNEMPADAIDHGPDGDPFHDAQAYEPDEHLDALYEDRYDLDYLGE